VICLPVVFKGVELWFLTLREVQRLGVFENEVVRRILGPKSNAVIGCWGKLLNEELHSFLYSSPYIIMMI
jgi:hypothetical protein